VSRTATITDALPVVRFQAAGAPIAGGAHWLEYRGSFGVAATRTSRSGTAYSTLLSAESAVTALATETPGGRSRSCNPGTRWYATPTDALMSDRAATRAVSETPARKRTSTRPGTTRVPGGTYMTPVGETSTSLPIGTPDTS
jgi:hypothetical protein